MSSSAEKVAQPQKTSTHPPKRFLFEFLENRSRKNTDPRATPTGANREKSQKAIPEIQYFPKPQNLEEAYQGICDSLILAYHEEKVNDFDNTIRQVNFQDPKGCLEFFKNLIFSFSQRLKGTNSKDESNFKPNEYEKMLQKSELKIRDLIRNEQIYRLGFDQLTVRQQEDEKAVANLEAIIQQNWTLIEQLNQENLKLSSLVKQKNEEIESISREKENYFSAQLSSSNADTFSARLKKYSSSIVQSMSPPNLQMPKKAHLEDYSKNPGSPERSTSITTGASKGRSLHKSGTTTDLIPSSLKNLNLHGIDKIKDEARNRIGVYTDRKQADTPGEQSQCNSARFAELSSLIKDQTDKKSFMKSQTHKVKKSLSVGKQRIKRDDPYTQERFSPSGRANNPEELAHALLKAELFEDSTAKSSFRMTKIDKTRNIGEWIKVNESHDLKSKSYKRKSVMSNIRSQNKESIPYMEEKSGEAKSQLHLRKEPSSSSILAKDITKIFPSENREKNTEKINKFLRNIMFQKLANSKKV